MYIVGFLNVNTSVDTFTLVIFLICYLYNGTLGGPKFAKYKGEFLAFISLKESTQEGYLMPILCFLDKSFIICCLIRSRLL
jgi:hypothetical protein